MRAKSSEVELPRGAAAEVQKVRTRSGTHNDGVNVWSGKNDGRRSDHDLWSRADNGKLRSRIQRTSRTTTAGATTTYGAARDDCRCSDHHLRAAVHSSRCATTTTYGAARTTAGATMTTSAQPYPRPLAEPQRHMAPPARLLLLRRRRHARCCDERNDRRRRAAVWRGRTTAAASPGRSTIVTSGSTTQSRSPTAACARPPTTAAQPMQVDDVCGGTASGPTATTSYAAARPSAQPRHDIRRSTAERRNRPSRIAVERHTSPRGDRNYNTAAQAARRSPVARTTTARAPRPPATSRRPSSTGDGGER